MGRGAWLAIAAWLIGPTGFLAAQAEADPLAAGGVRASVDSTSLARLDLLDSFTPAAFAGTAGHSLGNLSSVGLSFGAADAMVSMKVSFFSPTMAFTLDEAVLNLTADGFLLKLGKQDFVWGFGKLAQPAYFLTGLPTAAVEYRDVFNAQSAYGMSLILPGASSGFNLFVGVDGRWSVDRPRADWGFAVLQGSRSWEILTLQADIGWLAVEGERSLHAAVESEVDLGQGWIARVAGNLGLPFSSTGMAPPRPSAIIGIDWMHPSGWFLNLETGYRDGFELGLLAGVSPADSPLRLTTLHRLMATQGVCQGNVGLQLALGGAIQTVRLVYYGTLSNNGNPDKIRLSLEYSIRISN
jgi:hypothetical protein